MSVPKEGDIAWVDVRVIRNVAQDQTMAAEKEKLLFRQSEAHGPLIGVVIAVTEHAQDGHRTIRKVFRDGRGAAIKGAVEGIAKAKDHVGALEVDGRLKVFESLKGTVQIREDQVFHTLRIIRGIALDPSGAIRFIIAVMKSLELYDELKNTFQYLCSSWLKYRPNQSTEDDANVILAASAFLFDNLFTKEDAGRALTAEAAKDLGTNFKASALSAMATKIRLGMSEEDILKGGTQLRDYIKWVAEEHPVILDVLKDQYGLLVVATAEEIASLIIAQDKDLIPIEAAELTLLNLTRCFHLFYKEIYGTAFQRNPSASYFLDVESEMERITKEITD